MRMEPGFNLLGNTPGIEDQVEDKEKDKDKNKDKDKVEVEERIVE